MCVWRPAAGPTQAINRKFGVGSSFHSGSAPSWGATPKCWPPAPPTGPPTAHPLLLLSSLDESAQDYFTIVLWNNPGQRRVIHACYYLIWCISDPEVILDDPDNDETNPDEDYEGYEGYYDDDDGDAMSAADQGGSGQSESSQGRLTRLC